MGVVEHPGSKPVKNQQGSTDSILPDPTPNAGSKSQFPVGLDVR